jgi:Family of unknown function (DUF6152)
MKTGRLAKEGGRLNPVLVLAALVGSFIVPGLALAHHGEAAYETTKKLTVRATMTEFDWANPHCQLFFDVSDTKGKVEHWSVQAINPLMLSRYGWTRDSLKPGDMITVVFRPAKNGEMAGILDKVVLGNGRELPGHQSEY